ncbi:CBS domain-containing protein [Sulfuriferula plumbiphila]|uniref:CBS domain-containing protein n=1 Tax=Sulfuriferula plumbiphila TaxID=171865 RepID=A0A512LBT8_9PROT|nr:CBS domain-containing protein [Sulfuriferula plumbiphila]BBP04130.1 CBS domain-containing protein [Sulfuriferula plumbiphila]GEP31955.1 CBS domain-containing protein [Sulfuriferula plumbiphila]
MIIREILTIKGGDIFAIKPDQLVSEAVAVMVEHDVGSLIVRQDGTMVGLLTERDVLRGLNVRGCALIAVKVSEMMVTEPIIGNPDDTVDYVRGVMTENRISHLPVMEGETLLGVISFHDVARACLNAADFENRLLKRYIKHWPE